MEKNIYETIAANVAPNAVAFIAANREADNASTPFARSALAAIVGGLSSLAMTESLVIAAFGSPKSPATGKPVKTVSGLRDMDGGARLYQAWKDVAFIVENIDADAPMTIGEADEAVTIGEGAIRKAVVAFILNEGDVKALFGAKGLRATVKALMSAHAEAIAKAHGVEADTDEADGEADGKPTDAPQSLTERATALLVALKDADDSAVIDAQSALALLADYIDSRWNAIADATAPVEQEAIAA